MNEGDVLLLRDRPITAAWGTRNLPLCMFRANVARKIRQWYILRLQILHLARTWRSSAQQHRDTASSGPPSTAQFLNNLADITDGFAAALQAAVIAWENQTLTIKEAAQESGYSQEALRRAIRNGGLPNAGRKHSPRIRRVDLPRKLNGGSNG